MTPFMAIPLAGYDLHALVAVKGAAAFGGNEQLVSRNRC